MGQPGRTALVEAALRLRLAGVSLARWRSVPARGGPGRFVYADRPGRSGTGRRGKRALAARWARPVGPPGRGVIGNPAGLPAKAALPSCRPLARFVCARLCWPGWQFGRACQSSRLALPASLAHRSLRPLQRDSRARRSPRRLAISQPCPPVTPAPTTSQPCPLKSNPAPPTLNPPSSGLSKPLHPAVCRRSLVRVACLPPGAGSSGSAAIGWMRGPVLSPTLDSADIP